MTLQREREREQITDGNEVSSSLLLGLCATALLLKLMSCDVGVPFLVLIQMVKWIQCRHVKKPGLRREPAGAFKWAHNPMVCSTMLTQMPSR